MNFYTVEFDNCIKEIRAINDQSAVNLAKGMLERWNQPSCKVYRTNPFSKERRKLLEIEYSLYDPSKPSLTQDNIRELISVEKPKKSKRERAAKAKRKGGKRVSYEVPLSDIAEKVGKDPAAIRRKLRKLGIPKPEGGWGWDSWDDPTVKEILSWFKPAQTN